MQLEPGEYFGIVRQIPDPNDTGTYYVRAEIRNARTDELIERVALTDRGSGRFQGEWQVISQGIDGGAYISVSTHVYTDSGYTTPSDMYGVEMQTYLVATRAAHLGGGGSGISRKDLREVLREVVPELLPEAADLDSVVQRILTGVGARHEALTQQIAGVSEKVDGIEVAPEVTIDGKEIDVEPLKAAIEAIAAAADARQAEVMKKVEGVMAKMEKTILTFATSAADHTMTQRELMDALSRTLTGGVADIRAIVEASHTGKADAVREATGAAEGLIPSPEEIIRGLRSNG